MEATPTLIIKYFSGFMQNLVPLFQRPYTWSEKQWRTLWDDIVSFYDVDILAKKASHFLGAVVTMPARSVPVGISKFLVIDGQQRLTTIALLMCAIRDSLSPEDQIQKRRVQKFYLTNEDYPDTEFFKLLPTQGDRDAYFPLIKNEGAAIPDSQFKKAYEFFRRRMRDEIDSGEKIDPRRILEIIETCLMVVMINLSDSDDPYLIFESLNFKGSPLEQADLVRNYFLMRFTIGEQPIVYEKHWLPMQNRLGATLTEFMRHFLGAEGEEVRKTDVYAAIKRLVVDSDSASVKTLMDRMERLSVFYSRLSGFAPEADEELSIFFEHFKRLDFGSVYPLLLSLYEDFDENQFTVDEFRGSLRVLHSFVIRRMVCGVPSNSLSGVFISLCRIKPVTVTPSAWLASALAKELKNRRWPSDAEFEDRWTRGQIYGSRACQIILESLERRYEHHEAAPFTEIQIEHIMPQVLTPDWENRLGSEFARTHADWLHTIGNLTLTGYNPELSNKPYPEKRAVYALSHFELNRYFGTCDEWNAMQIGRRAAKLFGIALQLWPRPSLVNTESAAANDKTAPAGFHAECVKLVQSNLGAHFLKLAQTRYQSADGQKRMMCAVSAEHNETGGTPYFWFALHKTQLDFLQQSGQAWICLGCGSAETTLLIALPEIANKLTLMSVTKTADRHYWHIVIAKRMGHLILRLLGGTDGPDLTDFNIGKGANQLM
jgi:uncharacterized protein with ParB-like and HNH nuclease domain